MVDKPDVQIGRRNLFTKYIMNEFVVVFVNLGKGG